jgi:hypothetical protein
MNTSCWAVAASAYINDLREGLAAALEKRQPVYNKGDKQ